MKSRYADLQFAGVEIALPAVLAIGANDPASARRTNVIVGFSAGRADSVVAVLAGKWLAQLCRRHFFESGESAQADLAAVAFYDKLTSVFSDDMPFTAALVPEPRSIRAADGGAAPDGLSNPAAGLALARWKFSGRVRAYVSPGNGIAQLTFDDLPGGITLETRSPFAASVARAFDHCHDVSAWYGFGVPTRDPAETVMMLRKQLADRRHAAAA